VSLCNRLSVRLCNRFERIRACLVYKREDESEELKGSSSDLLQGATLVVSYGHNEQSFSAGGYNSADIRTWHLLIPCSVGPLLTTAWRVLGLWMKGSCEYTG
jgi:hypothetical protein